ncbi:hypothetical protein NQ176_g1678 [Zarea fungicola]|uniref:Uncharacterized protein n=1 Tax=Zarea fungicola TaxID=93591 RepID=A0ACC1NU26_9HYPO|nr:hypothetical protein NQ176_g1678 [Lecanicillium fungicola]
MMQVPMPDLPVGMDSIHAAVSRRHGSTRSFRSEQGPYAHLWELLGYLPRRKPVIDHLVMAFLQQLNPVLDSVHPESFSTSYDNFWSARSGFLDMDSIDTRWLALLFIILAFGELLDCPQDCSPERQSEYEDSSQHFYWAARKAIVIAPTFSGESPDLVRAGILISRYLICHRRIAESWLTESFAVRMAQAQGMHIDGENWKLGRNVLETRRRLWSNLYILDRTTSMAIGRPYTINDRQCIQSKLSNIWLDDMVAEQAEVAQPLPLDQPTPSLYYVYQQQLAFLIGNISDECFNLSPTSSYDRYNRVMHFEKLLQDWKETLPTYFRLENPVCALDNEYPYLPWHRLWLHAAYHFVRVILHRAYVLLPSITDQYAYSREACITSACADLKSRLAMRNPSMADRIRFNVSAHSLTTSALVLGVIAVREPRSQRTAAILEDLQAFCGKQKSDRWVNEFELAEIHVVELCIARVKKSLQESRAALSISRTNSHVQNSFVQENLDVGDREASQSVIDPIPAGGDLPSFHLDSVLEFGDDWLDTWFEADRAFQEAGNLQSWEDLVEDLGARIR